MADLDMMTALSAIYSSIVHDLWPMEAVPIGDGSLSSFNSLSPEIREWVPSSVIRSHSPDGCDEGSTNKRETQQASNHTRSIQLTIPLT
jgi:hypothetical protein